jgi:hypothetical protein
MKQFLLVLGIVAVILFNAPAINAATPALIQHTDTFNASCGNPCSSGAITMTSNVTNGDRLYVAFGYCASDGTCTNSTSGANITSVAGSANLGSFVQDKCVFPNGLVACVYSAPVTGTGATTVTVTMSASNYWYLGGVAAEFSNVNSTYLDTTGGQNASTANPTATTTGNIAASGELLLGYAAAVSSLTTPSGYTNIDAANNTFAYKIGSSSGSTETVTWTAAAAQYSAIITANIPTAGGGGGTCKGGLLMMGFGKC